MRPERAFVLLCERRFIASARTLLAPVCVSTSATRLSVLPVSHRSSSSRTRRSRTLELLTAYPVVALFKHLAAEAGRTVVDSPSSDIVLRVNDQDISEIPL
jgi:hypothetical protein